MKIVEIIFDIQRCGFVAYCPICNKQHYNTWRDIAIEKAEHCYATHNKLLE